MLNKIIKKVYQSVSNYPKYQNIKSKTKKINPTLKKSEFNQKLNGYLIYQSKQSKSIKLISYFFVVCITGSIIKHHYTSEIQKMNDKIIIGIMITSFAIHQWRIFSTLKRIVIDRRGQNLSLIRYGIFGHFQRQLQAPIQIMRGVTKATKFGGNMIYGGGLYGYSGQSFWFHSDGIINKQIFQAAVSGKKIDIID